MAMQASKLSRMSVATQCKWDGANTRKQPPGNSNSDRNAQQTIKRSRSGREKGWSNNDSTAQQSKGSTGWWVVGFGDGLLKPEPLVLADDQERTERITPNVPTDGRGRGPRSYQATKILTPIAPVPQARVLLTCGLVLPGQACTPPKRQRRREGYGQPERSASECRYERQPRLA